MRRLCSVFVKGYEVLHLLEGHWLGNEVDLNLAALLEHALRAGRSTCVHIDSHGRLLFKQAVD